MTVEDSPEHEVAWAAVSGPLRLENVLFQAKKSGRLAPLQIVNANLVVGTRHITEAARMCNRARAEGRGQADRTEIDFLRYLAGEPQIQKAIEKMGILDECDAAVVIALGPRRMDALRHFVEALGCKEDDTLLEADETTLAAFGITETQIQAATTGRAMDLIVEAVARVDLG